MPERSRPNHIYVTFADAANRTNWLIDADDVRSFYHTYDVSASSRYICLFLSATQVKFYENNTIFSVYDEEAGEYVRLLFNDVIGLLARKDRDVTNFSKTLRHRPVNLFKMANDILAYVPEGER